MEFYYVREPYKGLCLPSEQIVPSTAFGPMDNLGEHAEALNCLSRFFEILVHGDSSPDNSPQKVVDLLLIMKDRAESFPADSSVVGLNSMVCIQDMDSGEKFCFHLVAPDDIDTTRNKVSIYSPLGTTLTGLAAGAEVQWSAPSRLRRFRILSVG